MSVDVKVVMVPAGQEWTGTSGNNQVVGGKQRPSADHGRTLLPHHHYGDNNKSGPANPSGNSDAFSTRQGARVQRYMDVQHLQHVLQLPLELISCWTGLPIRGELASSINICLVGAKQKKDKLLSTK